MNFAIASAESAPVTAMPATAAARASQADRRGAAVRRHAAAGDAEANEGAWVLRGRR